MDTSNQQHLAFKLKQNFGLDPTDDQYKALQALAEYCLNPEKRRVFLLKGYAGTGKTSLIKTLVKTLPAAGFKTTLLAPTGKAAKVMTLYSQKAAYTIHKHIYWPKKNAFGGASFSLKENKASNTLYVVDEASMIQEGTANNSTGQSLLEDLLHFVQMGKNCKLLLVGDIAQLPPVGSNGSYALDSVYLKRAYGLEVDQVEMKVVMRQVKDSVILSNATQLRQLQLDDLIALPRFKTGPDFIRLTEGYEVEEALNHSFSNAGKEETAILVRSNKRASLYNRQIRARILWQEDEINAGDYLMVVKNNYHWLPEESKAGFIANGDTIELLQIFERNAFYGYNYVRANVRMVDYPQEPPFETVILLDVLDMPSAALSWEQSRALYNTILEDYQDLPSKYQQHQEVRRNPFYNALQVKFSYAITGHKAQGGQWENVFIEKPWLPEGKPDLELLRWLYTAITRAKEKVFLMGFDEPYFDK
jgi:exodeoxyribonuclease-5